MQRRNRFYYLLRDGQRTIMSLKIRTNEIATIRVVPKNIASIFSSNSEANASELLENNEEMFLRDWLLLVDLEQICKNISTHFTRHLKLEPLTRHLAYII